MRIGICFFTMVMVHVGVSAFAYDWSSNPGDGSPQNPYQISEPNHLMSIGSDPVLLDKHFILTNDIVFDPDNKPAHVFTRALIAPDLNPTISPTLYDFQGTKFSGIFDGNNSVIYNLTILSVSDYVGLFGYIDSGQVRNLSIENTIIEGGHSMGILAGYAYNSTISYCFCSGIITNNTDYGGRHIGGLVGRMQNGEQSHSNFNGEILAYSNVGGLVGNNWGATISNCFSSGTLNGYSHTGGAVGINQGLVYQTYSSASINGISTNGLGIAGLVGTNGSWGIVEQCYYTGYIISKASVWIGGLIGHSDGIVTDSFWNISSSGMTSSDGGIGLDDPNMMIQANFVGWDFVGESANGDNEIWRMCVDGVDYPRLSWEFAQNGDFACGDGVDFADLQALTEQWLTSVNTTPTTFNYACDANGDEQINLRDFTMLSENWP